MKLSMSALSSAVALSGALAVSPAVAETTEYTVEEIYSLMNKYKPEIVNCGEPIGQGVKEIYYDENWNEYERCVTVKDWIVKQVVGTNNWFARSLEVVEENIIADQDYKRIQERQASVPDEKTDGEVS